MGYTSTSRSEKCALQFAFMASGEGKEEDGTIPVVFQIKFGGACGLFELTDEYTAYPGENEVLV